MRPRQACPVLRFPLKMPRLTFLGEESAVCSEYKKVTTMLGAESAQLERERGYCIV